MTVQRFLEIEQAMSDPAWISTKNVLTALNDVKNYCNTAMEQVKSIYDPLTDTWNIWCMTNLQLNERNNIKQIYNKMKALVDNINV